MKIQTVITGLILGFLLGCSETQNPPITQPTPTPPVPSTQSTNEFDSVSFPQDACGDNLPEDPQAYPVEFYPVYIDYSESNLQAVTSKFCRDALKKHRKSLDKDYIQVASFTTPQRANQFKDLMVRELGSGEVGETTTINLKVTAKSADSFTDPQSIAEAALLTPEQVKQLVAMDGNNSKGIEFKVIVPTYIPAGFKVEKVETADRAGAVGGLEYRITYRNSRDACFSIIGSSGGWGAGPGEQHSFEVNPPALGKLLLGYTEFNRATRKPSISFQEAPIIKGKQGYGFNSPAIDRKCDVIKIQDGIKIANSLQYLNP